MAIKAAALSRWRVDDINAYQARYHDSLRLKALTIMGYGKA
jgi:hypothetical protein